MSIDLKNLQRNMVRKFQILYQWARSFFVTTATTATRQTGSKKFDILQQRQSSIPPRNNRSRDSGKFTTVTTTRPQVCPICRTSETSQPGNIFRPNDQKWGCKACGHTWRS